MFDFLQEIFLLVPPVLLALTAHECAHAWVASRLGDQTARMLGRVTLNPLKHLDPVGIIVLFLTRMFGWAKPVPVNPRNFKDPAKCMMLVSLAGPATNLFLAAAFALVYKLIEMGGSPLLVAFPGVFKPLFIMVKISVLLNVALAVFNMIPIPPLDGSKVLMNLLPPEKAFAFSRLEPYGFMILIVLLMTGVIGEIISPLIWFATGFLLGGAV